MTSRRWKKRNDKNKSRTAVCPKQLSHSGGTSRVLGQGEYPFATQSCKRQNIQCVQNLVGKTKRRAAAQIAKAEIISVVIGKSLVPGANTEHCTGHEDVLSQSDGPHDGLLIGRAPYLQLSLVTQNQWRRHEAKNKYFILFPSDRYFAGIRGAVGYLHIEQFNFLPTLEQSLTVLHAGLKIQLFSPVGTVGDKVMIAQIFD